MTDNCCCCCRACRLPPTLRTQVDKMPSSSSLPVVTLVGVRVCVCRRPWCMFAVTGKPLQQRRPQPLCCCQARRRFAGRHAGVRPEPFPQRLINANVRYLRIRVVGTTPASSLKQDARASERERRVRYSARPLASNSKSNQAFVSPPLSQVANRPTDQPANHNP